MWQQHSIGVSSPTSSMRHLLRRWLSQCAKKTCAKGPPTEASRRIVTHKRDGGRHQRQGCLGAGGHCTEMLETSSWQANIHLLRKQLPRPGSDVGDVGDDRLEELQEEEERGMPRCAPTLSGLNWNQTYGSSDIGGRTRTLAATSDQRGRGVGRARQRESGMVVCGPFGLVGIRPWRHQPLHRL